MNTRNATLALLLAGSLSIQGAYAQQKPQPKPKPQAGKPKPAAHVSPKPTNQSGVFVDNGQAGAMGAAGPMLDSAALSKQPVFADLNEALRNPAKVYKLSLSNVEGLPPGIEKLKNLQILEISGRVMKPMMPPMPENSDAAGDMPPPPPPIPPMPGGGPNAELPPAIYDLKNLNVLKLHSLGIQNISKEISKLKNLRVLDLNGNSIMSLPENIGDLKNLRELRIDQCQMPNLPIGIANSKSIVLLETSVNTLPDIKSLRDLYYHSNSPMPPAGIESMANLRHLTFYTFGMQPGITGLFTKLRNLRELELPTAQLTFDDLMALNGLEKLEKLEIAGLRVTLPPPDLVGFNNLKQLKIMAIGCKDEATCAGIYQTLAKIHSKPALTIEYKKVAKEFFRDAKNLTIVINDPTLTNEDVTIPGIRGVILGSRAKTIPDFLANMPMLEELDISKAGMQRYEQLGSVISRLHNLKKLTISSDAFVAANGEISNMKNLQELTVKPGRAPLNAMDKNMLEKRMTKTKIVFED